MHYPILLVAAALVIIPPEGSPAAPSRGAAPVSSPTPVQTPVPESVTRGFAQVSQWILQAAEAVPAERYGFRPTDGVRTFAQLVAHLVDSYHYYCRLAKGPAEWADPVERGVTAKAELTRQLAAATGECRQVHAGGKVDPLVENLAHTNLHYGNLTTYLRLMGIVPPSSR